MEDVIDRIVDDLIEDDNLMLDIIHGLVKEYLEDQGCIEEIWKDIDGYEGLYQISNLGRVKTLERMVPVYRGYRYQPESIKKTVVDKLGYEYVMLVKDGKRKNHKLARLVALHFIPNPDNLPNVMHIDNNRANSRVDNLKWVSVYDNMQGEERKQKIGHWSTEWHKANAKINV